MIFSAHAIVGAAVAQMFPENPVLGFCAAFASHFVCDAIPHWEYHLRSAHIDSANELNNDMKINRAFLFDLARMGLDALLGVAVAAYLFQPWFEGVPEQRWLPETTQWMIGVVGGLLPDFLQFVYWKLRREPLIGLQKFHLWIHSKKKLDKYPILGILFQIACVAAIVATTIFVRFQRGA